MQIFTGARTIIIYKTSEIAFFVFGFTKADKNNLTSDELRAIKKLSQELLSHTKIQLERAKQAGELVEL